MTKRGGKGKRVEREGIIWEVTERKEQLEGSLEKEKMNVEREKGKGEGKRMGKVGKKVWERLRGNVGCFWRKREELNSVALQGRRDEE